MGGEERRVEGRDLCRGGMTRGERGRENSESEASKRVVGAQEHARILRLPQKWQPHPRKAEVSGLMGLAVDTRLKCQQKPYKWHRREALGFLLPW